jgi:hypothetical protein
MVVEQIYPTKLNNFMGNLHQLPSLILFPLKRNVAIYPFCPSCIKMKTIIKIPFNSNVDIVYFKCDDMYNKFERKKKIKSNLTAIHNIVIASYDIESMTMMCLVYEI